ncbi:MAG: hypothetical protein RR582_11630, partial [Niameybacter sp.]
MNKKWIIVGTVGVVILLCFIAVLLIPQPSMAKEPQETIELSTVSDIGFPEFIYRNEGYSNLAEWWTALQEKRSSFAGSAEKVIVELGEYLTEEDK